MPGFYIDVLKAWAEARQKFRTNDQNSPRDIILWNIKDITIGGKSVYWKDWHTAGIERIKDLLDDNNIFLRFNQS